MTIKTISLWQPWASFRFKLHTLTRLNSFVAGTSGKRLTYKALIA